MKSSSLRYLFCLLLALLMASVAENAQAQMVAIKVHTKIVAGTKANPFEKVTSVRYYMYRSEKKANEAKDKIEAAIERANKSAGLGGDEEALESAIQDVSKKLGIVWEISQPTGVFETNVIAGSAILILGDESLEVLKINNDKKAIYEVKLKGRMEIRQVDITGEAARLNFIDRPTIDTGNSARFNINYFLAKGKTNETNRLFIQPIVIECQSEDTVAFLEPFIYEGEEYHKLQDKRFGYDYMTNDSVARGYHPEQVLSRDRDFEMSHTVTFHKPNKDASYRCVYPVVLEDYHHVISKEGKENGSCNSIRPFKFLDLSTGVAEMQLTSQFREAAGARFDEHQQDISLTFKTNSDELTDDSLNIVKIKALSKELHSYGDKLFQVTVQGGASAEGSVEHNTKLAQQRSNRALRLLAGYGLPSDVGRTTLPPKVYTWDDVLAAVEKQGNQETTDIVRNTIANHKQNEVFGILKSLPIFEPVIEPILVSQRMMRCQYMVTRERVMEPDEAVEEYFAHKKEYVSRTAKKPLSMGDYYNLFMMIKDSLELDTLTQLAYSQMVEQPRYETLPIAPYLANRMAVRNLRRGTADLNVLRPFINYKIKKINYKMEIDKFHSRLVNLEDILLNQATTFFIAESEKSDTARYIIEQWLPQTEKVRKVQMLNNFQSVYLNYLAGELTDPADIKRAKDAEAYVLNSSSDNRAIIYTELRSFLNKSREDVEPLVDNMSDDNPKKWYLKALLWVKEAGKEPKVDARQSSLKHLTDVEVLQMQREDPERLEEYYRQLAEESKKAENEVKVDNVPYFLAYFQHSFDMQPDFKKYFYREGNIDEDVRKKYKYRKKDIPAYRKMFELLKAADDSRKQYDKTHDGENEAQPANDDNTTNQQEDNSND